MVRLHDFHVHKALLRYAIDHSKLWWFWYALLYRSTIKWRRLLWWAASIKRMETTSTNNPCDLKMLENHQVCETCVSKEDRCFKITDVICFTRMFSAMKVERYSWIIIWKKRRRIEDPSAFWDLQRNLDFLFSHRLF